MSDSSALKRSLGLRTSIALVVGGIIGSGIFMKPSTMAAQLGSPEWLIAVWILAGIVTLFGALTNAEVAAMIPETGGQYVFFRVMYGDFVAFLYGWTAFAVFNTAGVASIAYVLATYSEYFVDLPRFSTAVEQTIRVPIPGIGVLYPLENFGVKAVAITVVAGLTAVNFFSTRSGGNLQFVLTAVKVVLIVLIVVSFLTSSQGAVENLFQDATPMLTGWAFVGGLIAAISGAFWGYDGWNNITFVAGEMDDPQRNIPKSLTIGLLICIGVYSTMALAYTYVLPIESIAASNMVASDAAAIVLGGVGGGIIALMIIISTFGTTNANVLATARVSFAMARENNFFPFIGKVHPRFNTPGNALIVHGVWTCLLTVSGSFDLLTDMLIFVSWLFYGMSAVGLFILRRKWKHVHRPYRVWGYPVVPIIFITFTAFFLVATLINDVVSFMDGRTTVINSLLGLALMAAGIPFYWHFKKKKISKR